MQMVLAQWGGWFRRGWPLWGSALLALIGVVVLLCVPITNDNIRRLGMLYETSGTLTVLADLIKIIKDHKLRPLEDFKEYLRSSPLRRPAVINLSGAACTQSAASGSLGSVAVVPTTLEDRVKYLETRMSGVESGIARESQRITAEEQARKEADQAEAAARTKSDAELREGIKSSEIGTLYPTVVGLVWLLIGMAMTTGTPEVCMLLNCPPDQACPAQEHEGPKVPPLAWPSVRT